MIFSSPTSAFAVRPRDVITSALLRDAADVLLIRHKTFEERMFYLVVVIAAVNARTLSFLLVYIKFHTDKCKFTNSHIYIHIYYRNRTLFINDLLSQNNKAIKAFNICSTCFICVAFKIEDSRSTPAPAENYVSHDAPRQTFPAADVNELNAIRSKPDLFEELEGKGQPETQHFIVVCVYI